MSPPCGSGGQPNCGKSTLFNMLTGARQHVAYPGVTVEKRPAFHSGRPPRAGGPAGHLQPDLLFPGEKNRAGLYPAPRPQVTINVADAAQPQTQPLPDLLEMETPLVLALNMMDVAARRNIQIGYGGPARELGVAVIPTVGKKVACRACARLAAAAQAGRRPSLW